MSATFRAARTPFGDGPAARAAPGAVALPATGTPPRPVVRLAGVTRRFGATPALDGVSLAVALGEVLGIIGRSGAGKSTLIRCLNGLERPDAGDVEILGHGLAGLTERELRRTRGRIGMIFQGFNLLSAKTVAENVALPLRIAGVARARRAARVAELLRLVGLDGRADSYPAQLSGGQKQRVGIARALAAEPALLLSDEATSALDPETTASILDLLRDINRQLGLTIVMITHEMSVVRAVADRVIVLDRGRVVEEGATAQVFAAPAAELTRRLIGAAHHAPDPVPPGRLFPAYRPGAQAVLRLTATGEAARQPLLGAITRAAGTEPLVLAAQVERLHAGPVSILTLALPVDGPEGAEALPEALRRALPDASIHLEVLGYADDPL